MDTDPQTWLYAPANRQVIFPYNPSAETGKASADKLYRAWSALLNGTQLGFVKPHKQVLPAPEQAALAKQVREALMRDVAAYAAVDKIHLMGSALRGDMGRYSAPFVHSKLAKLGSDVDILVEIDPEREDDIPAAWDFYVAEASNRCAIYTSARFPWPRAPTNGKAVIRTFLSSIICWMPTCISLPGGIGRKKTLSSPNSRRSCSTTGRGTASSTAGRRSSASASGWRRCTVSGRWRWNR